MSILTYYTWFQVHHYSPRHMLPSACFIEKRGKRVIIVEFILHILEGAIWLNAMLQAEEFPARISYLNSSLANMNRDALTLRGESRERQGQKNQCMLTLLILSGYFFPVYCFSNKKKWIVTVSISFGCSTPWPQWDCTYTPQMLGQFFIILKSMYCNIWVHENRQEKKHNFFSTNPTFPPMDWLCWGPHLSSVYFYSRLEPDTAMWYPSN